MLLLLLLLLLLPLPPLGPGPGRTAGIQDPCPSALFRVLPFTHSSKGSEPIPDPTPPTSPEPSSPSVVVLCSDPVTYPRVSATPASRRSHVHRRGILDLAGTVSCVGTRSPMAYVDYGCFCGLGGHGQPRDAIDWCCHRHDCCYARAEEAGCSPKMEHYPWECVGQQVLCGPTEDKCQELMCKCDQEIAHCFAQNEYNLKYLFYPQFLCEQDSPKCD